MDVVDLDADAPPTDAELGSDRPAGDAADAPIEATVAISKLGKDRQFEVLKKLFSVDADHTKEWRAEATFCFGFRAGEQWSDDDKALLADQQRPVIVFNRVLTILKAVAGMEINGRHETTFLPRGTEDTAVNEVLSAASKWMADECDGEDEESQAFDDCATCGMGWVENRMSYEDDAAGLYVEDQIDPREMYWDRTATKKNLSNARRLSRVRRMPISDALALFPGKNRVQLDAAWCDDGLPDSEGKTIEQKRRRDSDNSIMDPYDDTCEVTLVQMQWFEREPYWIVGNVQDNSKSELSEAEYAVFVKRMGTLKSMALAAGADASAFEVHSARLQRKVYKQAWLGGELLQAAGPSPIVGKFSWDCITGEFDKKKKQWFGLVKVMRDPQMWANKWLSQILHILNTTAKGGILAETTAFEDEREAENGYARPDTITWLADGALSGDKPKIMAKPGAGMTDGYLGLMTFAISSIKDVTGINLELLGQQDQNQPGILEAMRKQAGMTVLATLFDSLRRFRKNVGRSRLYFIQNFLSDDRLIRVASPEKVEMVKLAKDKTVGLYSVIVDDTPTSPNQKEANWAIIQPLLAVFKDQLMANPQVFVMLLEYSPLPSRIVDAIKGFIEKQANDPETQRKAKIAEQLTIATAMSKINKDESAATLNNAKAGGAQATATFDMAMARNMLEDNDRQGLRAMFDHFEAQQNAVKAQAEAETERAKTQRELAGVHVDAVDAGTRRLSAETEHHKAVVGGLIDNLSTLSTVHRNAAAARKDDAVAAHTARKPVTAA